MKLYKPEHLEMWSRPNHYIGDNFFDYYLTGIGQHRDSNCLERANFKAMLSALGGESKTVIVSRAGHWAVGWVECILIHQIDTKSLKLADQIMNTFEDYPVIDDGLLREEENDELHSVIDCYKEDFRKTICSFLGCDFKNLSSVEQNDVDALILDVMHEDAAYRGVEDAFLTDESLIRGIEQSKYWGDVSNLTIFFQHAFDVEAKKEV